MLHSNVVKYVRQIGEIVRYLSDKTKFRLALQLSLLRRSRAKSAKASPNSVLRVLQMSSKSVHFRQSYSRTRVHRQPKCAVE